MVLRYRPLRGIGCKCGALVKAINAQVERSQRASLSFYHVRQQKAPSLSQKALLTRLDLLVASSWTSRLRTEL
jgi:hypothetical protein